MMEPATVLTDYLLAAVLLVLAWRVLRQDRQEPQTARRMWAWAFVALALSALAGGTWHGFSGRVEARTAAALWKATVYFLGLTDLLMLWGSSAAALGRRARPYVLAAAAAKFLVYAVFMARHVEYRYVVYDYAPSMVAILLFHAVPGSLRNDPGARSILAGLGLSFVAALVQLARLAPHPHFNHNDLYHVIQIAACCVLYRGVIRLRDRRSDPSQEGIGMPLFIITALALTFAAAPPAIGAPPGGTAASSRGPAPLTIELDFAAADRSLWGDGRWFSTPDYHALGKLTFGGVALRANYSKRRETWDSGLEMAARERRDGTIEVKVSDPSRCAHDRAHDPSPTDVDGRGGLIRWHAAGGRAEALRRRGRSILCAEVTR